MQYIHTRIATILFSIACAYNCSYSQSTEQYKVEFKDYHSTNIYDIKLTNDKKHIITSDEDGKVLMYDANTFDYIKTIKTPGGIPISGLQLIKNDSVLMMSQRYPLNFKVEFDTMIMTNLYTDKFHKQQLSFNLNSLDVDDYFGSTHYENQQNKHIFSLTNNNLKTQFSVPFGYIAPKILAVSHDLKKMAYITEMSTNLELIIINTDNQSEQKTNIIIPENLKINLLFFDKETNDLYANAIDNEKQKLIIYNLNRGAFNKAVYTIDDYVYGEKFISQYDGNLHIMTAVNTSFFPTKPLVLTRNNTSFAHHIVNLPQGVTNATINTKQKEIIYVNQSNFKNIKDFSVYNYATKNVTHTFPKATSNFYSSTFLPDNSWVAFTTGYGTDIINENIKYFETGTFYNRFQSLSFKDYLETKHKLQSYYARLIDNSGIAVIYGNKKNSFNQTNYYIYDFAKDKLTQITDTKLEHIAFQDYNVQKNILLLGNGYYINQGHNESVEFQLIYDNKVTTINGAYKFGKISNDGNYLLTIDKSNNLKIEDINTLKVIYTKELKEGSYTLHSIDESSFMVSNAFRMLQMNECNKETDIFEIKNNEVSINNIPCVIINNVSHRNKNVGFVMENIGVGINQKLIPFTKSDYPKHISFNNDGSKFMLSFHNGKNAIYDTETLQPLGYMIHPDEKTHIFNDVNYNYFSNINPKQFLKATKNSQPIALKEVEKKFFNPEKILYLFGDPNNNYITALQKALELRNNSNDVANDNVEYDHYKPSDSDIINTETTITNSNLYLLSIGVSDYEDTSYSLTFSDKDAIDIAKIYGTLNSDQIKTYNDKFFGQKHSLYNQNDELIGTINNYAGIYNSTSNKYLLNTAGTIWLETKNDSCTIWNYQTKTINPISLPNSNDTFSYTDLNESLYVMNDDSGFYLKRDDVLYEYRFNTKNFAKVALPFEPKKDNFRPINNNKWLYFDDEFFQNKNSLTITTGTFNSKKNEATFTLNFENSEKVFRDIQPDGTVKIDTTWNYHKELKAASSNGKIIFYTMGTDRLFYLDLNEKDIIPTRLPTQKDNMSFCEISVDSEAKQFYIIESFYDLDEKQITYYDFKGQKLSSRKYDLNMKNDGIVNDGKSYYYIKQEESLLSKNHFNNTDDVLENNTPYSYQTTYTSYIINENANSKNITQQLESFFEKTTPNDQIIIFLAGHGVLDKSNNYYFAPYDMDFDKVDKNGISFKTIVESLKNSPATNKLLLMDTCHSGKTIDLDENIENSTTKGPRKKGERGSKVIMGTEPDYKVSDVITTLFEDFLSNSGITIISASSGGDLAQEHPDWGNGAFTSSYIKILKSKMNGSMGTVILSDKDTKTSIPLDESFIDDLYKEVISLTNGKQIPDLRELNKKARIIIW